MEEADGAVVGFDKKYVADDGKQDVEECVKNGADFDFATTALSGENNEKWCRKNDGEGDELSG